MSTFLVTNIPVNRMQLYIIIMSNHNIPSNIALNINY